MKPRDAGADLSVSHQRGVFSHQDVGAEEEDEGVAEAQEGPVQKGLKDSMEFLLMSLMKGKNIHLDLGGK